ncbi:fusaric acid resistance protein FusB [Gluconobacter kanchanaburiensis NBRC 103587]|nr:fusaric acid resistance protein FusB [Gluconobacter kanchanaburiensis NBRC 103587]
MAGYALRTTFTSLLALGIALWMELGSPQWAALTVWMVAQGTRGRSLAKAKWHLFGMIVGVISGISLVASFPQAPLMFILLLAGGIGAFCMIGTFMPGPASMTNYRIHGMRASGFTYAIVSLDGIADPHHIFAISMARATYILLGIVLEASISGLFQLGLTRRTRQQLANTFEDTLKPALTSIADILCGKEGAMQNVQTIFTQITTLGDQVEFAEVELGRHDHAGDHARAALADIAVLLARALDLATLMRLPLSQDDMFHREAEAIRDMFLRLPARLEGTESMSVILADLLTLRRQCRQKVVLDFTTVQPDDIAREAFLRHGMLQQALVELIDALRMALSQFEASRHPKAHDHFHAPIRSYRDWQQAVTNSLRSSVTVFGAGLIWICTAWPSGLTFIMFVCIICSLFSTLERPALATQAFLRGACCAVIAAGVINLELMGKSTTFEMLGMWSGLAMMLGGLAFAYPPLALPAVSYNLFLPILIGPSNQAKTNEIVYFNTAMPLLLGLLYASWMYRTFLPYDPARQRWTMREHILRELHRIAEGRTSETVDSVVSRNVDRFVRLMTNSGSTPSPVIQAYLTGILSSMRVMLNLLRLQAIGRDTRLEKSARQALSLVMGRMSHFSGRYHGHYGRTLRATKLAILRLRTSAYSESRARERFVLIAALTSLDVIATELDTNRIFFDARSPYLDPSTSPADLQVGE